SSPVSAFLSAARLTIIRVSLAAALLLFIAVSSQLPPLRADWRQLISTRQHPDPITEQDRAYHALIPWLPKNGRIGYLQPPNRSPVDATRRFFLAEYALTPRVVVMDTQPEFVIISSDPETDTGQNPAISDAADPSVAGFTLYRQANRGLSIFRRLR